MPGCLEHCFKICVLNRQWVIEMNSKAGQQKAESQEIYTIVLAFFLFLVITTISNNLGQIRTYDRSKDARQAASYELSAERERVIPPILTSLLLHEGGLSQAPVSYDSPFAPEAPIAPFAQQVSFINQYPELPTGCESVALTIALRSMGFNLEKTTIVDAYLDYSDGDFVNAYVGDPYSYEGMGVYPPGLVNAANSYLADQGSKMRAYDITGTAWNDLFVYVEKGYPVLIWVTIDSYAPSFIGVEQDEWIWYENEHCVVLYEVAHESGQVSISDPTYGDLQQDLESYGRIFAACGSMAVIIY